MSESPDRLRDPFAMLRRATPARIGLGRAGQGLPTGPMLAFQLAHARAQDAVHTPLDVERVRAALGIEVIEVHSAAPDRQVYLQNPNLGRRMDQVTATLPKGDYDLAFVIADGLSATAVHAHAADVVLGIVTRLDGWTVAPVVIARQARVAIGDPIGHALGANLVVVLIGERPGLSAADSLGVYITWAPTPQRRDSERNCVSNIRPGGLGPEKAAEKIVWLLREARRLELTGVLLKDRHGDGERLDAPIPNSSDSAPIGVSDVGHEPPRKPLAGTANQAPAADSADHIAPKQEVFHALERGRGPMRIAILQTGIPPAGLDQLFGGYPDMFVDLLAGGGRTFQTYDVTEDIYPDPRAFDALLVTGSSAGVYEPLPWISPLKEFLCAQVGTPMIGICFGHQIMAEAFGGKVEKSGRGWGVGSHRYKVSQAEPWMEPLASFAISASHEDQVVIQPPDSVVTAASDFTPFAGLSYIGRPAISFQGHPEFDPAFAEALIEVGRGTRFSDAIADAAVSSLRKPNDRAVVAGWIVNFLDKIPHAREE